MKPVIRSSLHGLLRPTSIQKHPRSSISVETSTCQTCSTMLSALIRTFDPSCRPVSASQHSRLAADRQKRQVRRPAINQVEQARDCHTLQHRSMASSTWREQACKASESSMGGNSLLHHILKLLVDGSTRRLFGFTKTTNPSPHVSAILTISLVSKASPQSSMTATCS